MKKSGFRHIYFPLILFFMGIFYRYNRENCKKTVCFFAVHDRTGNGLYGARLIVCGGGETIEAHTDFRGYAEVPLKIACRYTVNSIPPEGYKNSKPCYALTLDKRGVLSWDGEETNDCFIAYTLQD